MSDATRGRAVRPDDVPALVRLFAEVFGHVISPDHYRWKVLTRPSPVEAVGIAVDDADRPVFHIAGIPCQCNLAGAQRWVMVAVDAMTAPPFRRRGLLSRYSVELFERWQAAGVALVLGLPNRNWGSRARALGWQPLGPLSALVLPLRPERILARKLRVPALDRVTIVGQVWRGLAARPASRDARVQVHPVTGAGDEFDALWLRAGSSVARSLVRDRAWVEWRYLTAPGTEYRVLLATRDGVPVGYAACGFRDPHTATIADVFTAPGDTDAFRALVAAVIRDATDRGADLIRALAAEASWPHRALRAAGFLRTRHALGVEYVQLDRSLTRADIGAIGDWYLVGGDFDAV